MNWTEKVARAIHALGRRPQDPDDWDSERGIHRAIALEAAEAALHVLEWNDVTLILHNARAYMIRERDDDRDCEDVERAGRAFMIERITSLLGDGDLT